MASTHHLVRLAASLVVLAAGISAGSALMAQPSKRAAPAPDRQEKPAGNSIRALDAFYDPPANVPDKPGSLLRAEPLKDVTLPRGMRGWRIFYTTTINDTTPATAVATVFA